MKRYIIFFSTGMIAALTASATLVATETFDYPTGQIDNMTGGTGWSVGWSSNGTAVVKDGALLCNDSNDQRRNMKTVTDGYTKNGRDLWVSWSQINTTLEASETLKTSELRFAPFSNDAVLAQQSTRLHLTKEGSVSIWNKTSEVTASGVTPANKKFMVIIQYEFNDSITKDVINVWITEDSYRFDGSQPPTLSWTGDINDIGDYMSFRSTTGMQALVNDFKVGTDYASVTPERVQTLGLLTCSL